MSWKCPICGRQNYETFNNCSCGNFGKESVFIKDGLMDGQAVLKEGEQFFEFAPDYAGDNMPLLQVASESHDLKVIGMPDSEGDTSLEELIKEIDSWVFTFSSADNCISMGTPALQSFRLKISLEDLEDLLEFLYRKTGKERTMRKCRISAEAIADVIDKVNRIVEEKRLKAAFKLNNDELQEIVDLINVKLKI